MRWIFGLTQCSHSSILLRPHLTKFGKIFKCFLNTFKVGLDISVGSALSMSLQSVCKSYSVCVHIFVFRNRNAFEVCISTKRSQN